MVAQLKALISLIFEMQEIPLSRAKKYSKEGADDIGCFWILLQALRKEKLWSN